ncbi:MAG: protein phosphatase 2C domain-containing protein [Acidobacteriota bacterium]
MPKAGEDIADCQDAYCVAEETTRFAISDGATQSYAADAWAKLLVKHACQRELPSETDFQNWLSEARDEWQRSRNEQAKQSSSWWTQVQARDAAATLVVGELQRRADGVWWAAVAVGDSCLMHIRGTTLTSFPLASASEFTREPNTILSGRRSGSEPPLLTGSGRMEIDDKLILATDALAKWILGSQTAWRRLLTIASEQELAELVESERATGRMVNDDVAIVIIDFSPPPPKRQALTPSVMTEVIASTAPPPEESKEQPPNHTSVGSQLSDRSVPWITFLSSLVAAALISAVTAAMVTQHLVSKTLRDDNLVRRRGAMRPSAAPQPTLPAAQPQSFHVAWFHCPSQKDCGASAQPLVLKQPAKVFPKADPHSQSSSLPPGTYAKSKTQPKAPPRWIQIEVP